LPISITERSNILQLDEIVYKEVLVFLTGIFGIWKAIPMGLLLKVNPVFVFLFTSLGAITGVLILFFFGNRIRDFIERKRKSKGFRKNERRAGKLLETYGSPGLGFLGCLAMGPNLTLLIGLAIVKSPVRFLYWTMAGILVWSLALTIVAVYSIELFHRIAGLVP
jgi:membrane protein DedA with SNARE-associated domain